MCNELRWCQGYHGKENEGLAAMFVMMNYERLSMGIQGLGASGLPTKMQHNTTDRIQGRASGIQSPESWTSWSW